jgi:hypothetical protein
MILKGGLQMMQLDEMEFKIFGWSEDGSLIFLILNNSGRELILHS